jgi:uncharacterized membrane protein (Fun14 family)
MVENKDAVNEAIEKLKPALSQFSFGGLMGYCSGMAMKKVGKGLAYVVGMGFMALQGAAFMGYIEIDWAKVKQDALKPLDKVRRFLIFSSRLCCILMIRRTRYAVVVSSRRTNILP